MSQQWHYSQNGAQYGPVDEAEIIRLIKSGELAPGTAVLKEGGSDWQPARNHNCFQVEIYPKTQSTTPAMNKCPCDQCGKNLKYPLEYEGMEIACPHCGQATLLTKPQGKPTSSLAPPPMASPGRATAVPPARSQAVPPAADPLADAAPRDLQQSVPAAPAAGRAEPDRRNRGRDMPGTLPIPASRPTNGAGIASEGAH